MRFFRGIKRFFSQFINGWNQGKEESKPREIPVTPVNLPESAKHASIGLVIGHNRLAQGADNYLGESEYIFNSRITHKLALKMREYGIKTAIIERPSGSYSSQCNRVVDELKFHECKYSIHFHFNSAGPTARGVEVLVVETEDVWDNRFGKIFSDILNERYQFIERGNDGVKTISSSHNGAGMLLAVKRSGITAALIEPCFANTRNKESVLIFESEDKYVDVLLEAIKKSFK